MRNDPSPPPRRRVSDPGPTLTAIFLLAAACTGAATAQDGSGTLSWGGYGLTRGSGADGAQSWREGGFGRLGFGDGDESAYGFGKAQLTVEWQPTTTVGFFLHAAARIEPEEMEGEGGGVVQAFATFDFDLRGADRWHTRVGHFLLPTSLENVEVGWSSPYTLTFSALNSWIGEEVRGSGLLSSYHLAIGSIDELAIGGMGLWNNDTAGTLLAWRGWALGDRLTVFDEVAPLPPVPALADGGAFGVQRDAGTTPFTEDLDGRAGWGAFLRWRRPEVATVQWTRFDNRGDRGFHGQEYAWDTSFDLLGIDYHLGPWSFAAEWLDGSTAMGPPGGQEVGLDFRAAYLLASWGGERFRFSVRYDDFETLEADFSVPDDINEGSGHAWTVAAFYESPTRPLRVGLEWLEVDGERPAAALVMGSPDTGGQTLQLELRYYFGSP